MVEVQLDADLRGVDTHGLQRLPWYVLLLRAGENKARPELRIIQETASSLAVDADPPLPRMNTCFPSV